MENRSEARSLREYLGVLRRYSLLIVAVVAITVAVAVGYSLGQSKLYRASVDVYIKNKSLVISQGTLTPAVNTLTADRVLQTQTILARTTSVAKLAVGPWSPHFKGPDRSGQYPQSAVTSISPQGLLNTTTVSPDPNADILTFSATSPVPELAVRLANGYAAAYVYSRNSQDTAAFAQAQRQTQQQIAKLQSQSKSNTFAYTQLVEQAAQYGLEARLAGSNASIAQPASSATKIQPTPLKSGLIGGVLGLVLGLALAFLAASLDTRLRSSDDAAEILRVPLLGRVPPPSRNLSKHHRIAMLTDNAGLQAEPYRSLRSNLEFANLRPNARVILVTSAIPREGKTTTVANLAVALARAGQRVALLDLDLRKPMIAEFCGLRRDSTGITDVASGAAILPDAMHRIALVGEEPPMNGSVSSQDPPTGHLNGQNGQNGVMRGVLYVVPAGALPGEPADFMSSPRLADTIRSIADQVDVVLIDSAPLLAVSDTMTLSRLVDGVLIVVKSSLIRRSTLVELRRVMDNLPCEKLGFVLTNANARDGYGYGYGHGYGYGYGYGGASRRETRPEVPEHAK